MMTAHARREYLGKIFDRYNLASRKQRCGILNEFCEVSGYNRKYAIRLLHSPFPRPILPRRGRPPAYGPETIRVLTAIWKAAGYPWSARLKSLLPRLVALGPQANEHHGGNRSPGPGDQPATDRQAASAAQA